MFQLLDSTAISCMTAWETISLLQTSRTRGITPHYIISNSSVSLSFFCFLLYFNKITVFSLVYKRSARNYCQPTCPIVLEAGGSHQGSKGFSHHSLKSKVWRGYQIWFVNHAKRPRFWNNRWYFQTTSRASKWLVADTSRYLLGIWEALCNGQASGSIKNSIVMWATCDSHSATSRTS